MLFNSFEFLYFFIVFFIVFKLASKHLNLANLIWILIIASLFFYAQWNYLNLLVLFSSIFVNFFMAKNMIKNVKKAKLYLILGIIFNIALLGFFKYFTFFLSLFFIKINFTPSLPLAISFFTFQQIAFLVDLYNKKIQLDSFMEYLFFVLFFPQLIAGPIVHYKDIIYQIKDKNCFKNSIINIQNGVFLFSIGLFKKVFLADSLAFFIDNIYSSIIKASFLDLWVALFAYSLKIYFDFSGYIDMALGIALMFGIILPTNFNSPYKAYDIIDFWRRWHITLSNFLRDYIYIPLGGSKNGKFSTFKNLLFTMLLGGLWHGAGWNFVIWGGVHGLFLGINHYLRGKFAFIREKKFKLPFILMTFLIISLLWVLFRAQNLNDAITYYTKLMTIDDIHLANWIKINMEIFIILLIGLFSVWFLPNSNSLLDAKNMNLKAFLAGMFFIISLKIMLGSPSIEFIYFQF